MKNPLGKTRDWSNPYATFENDSGWKWNVLKAWKQPAGEAKDEYAMWYCFVTSPMCPEGEYGDTYKSDVLAFGLLSYASPEFQKAYKDEHFHPVPTTQWPLVDRLLRSAL